MLNHTQALFPSSIFLLFYSLMLRKIRGTDAMATATFRGAIATCSSTRESQEVTAPRAS